MNDPVFPNDFSESERKFKPLPEPQTDEEWAKESNEKSDKAGSRFKVIDTEKEKVINKHLIWIVILLAMGIGVFGYFAMNNYLGSTFVDNSTCNATATAICSDCICNQNCSTPLYVNCSFPSINVNCNSTGIR